MELLMSLQFKNDTSTHQLQIQQINLIWPAAWSQPVFMNKQHFFLIINIIEDQDYSHCSLLVESVLLRYTTILLLNDYAANTKTLGLIQRTQTHEM